MVYVCTDPGIPVFGRKGASVHLQSVLRVLAARGVEAHLVCTRIGGLPPEGLEGVRVHALPPVTGAAIVDRERSAMAADLAVGSILDGLAAEAPVDLVYERYALWGQTGMSWAARRGVPSVLEVNAPLIQEQVQHRGLLDRGGAERVADRALGAATAVICVSDQVSGWARARVGDPRTVHTVANGVDTTRIVPAHGHVRPAAGDPFTVGFVGTLKPWHGVDTLVEALPLLLRRHPGYRVLLVGDGPEAEALAVRAAGLGVAGWVEATGSVDPAAIGSLLKRMDVAVAPYPELTDFYFSPLKVYEYLAAGLPVVASEVGGLAGLLEHGRLGALVRPGDPSALADAVDDLRLDVARRTRLRRSGVQRAAPSDWSHVVEKTLGLVGLTLPGVADAVA